MRWTLTPSTRGRAVAGLLLGFVLAGLVLALGPSATVTPADPGGSLPAGTQSAAVARQQANLPTPPTLPAIVVYHHADGTPLTADDVRAIRDRAAEMGATTAAIDAHAGRAVGTVTVQVAADASDTQTASRVKELRTTAKRNLPPGLQALVTGAPAFSADLAAVFDGADGTLLIATAAVVAVLLLLTYRSPILWVVPLLVVGLADQVAAVGGGAAARLFDVQVDDAATGILSVLVFGAGTDYALLLIARYRDELRRTENRYRAMRATLQATGPAILASGGTVTLAMLTLLVSDVPVTRGLGLVCAVGIVIAVIAALLLLPAALVLFGRWLFWPLVPRVGDPVTTERAGTWRRLGGAVVRRPVPVLAVGALILMPLLAPLLGVRVGLSPTQQFLQTPESVVGQRVLAAALPGGAAEPLVVTAPAAQVEQVAATARGVAGVAGVEAGARTGDLAVLSVVLQAPPGSQASDRSIVGLRSALQGTGAAVGGQTAEEYDLDRAQARDTRIVVPLVVAVVLLILVLLLRSLVAPVLLVGTVLLTWAAALGAGWLVFRFVYDFPALDRGVPLLTFLFLVALGVDYNIFLVTRLREEVAGGLTTARAAVRALAATGGVITSAGVLLAAVFAVLGVLPVIALTQIGTVVGLGVLLDTLLVRTIVVPALAALTGRSFWWPTALEHPSLSSRALPRPGRGRRSRRQEVVDAER